MLRAGIDAPGAEFETKQAEKACEFEGNVEYVA